MCPSRSRRVASTPTVRVRRAPSWTSTHTLNLRPVRSSAASSVRTTTRPAVWRNVVRTTSPTRAPGAGCGCAPPSSTRTMSPGGSSTVTVSAAAGAATSGRTSVAARAASLVVDRRSVIGLPLTRAPAGPSTLHDPAPPPTREEVAGARLAYPCPRERRGAHRGRDLRRERGADVPRRRRALGGPPGRGRRDAGGVRRAAVVRAPVLRRATRCARCRRAESGPPRAGPARGAPGRRPARGHPEHRRPARAGRLPTGGPHARGAALGPVPRVPEPAALARRPRRPPRVPAVRGARAAPGRRVVRRDPLRDGPDRRRPRGGRPVRVDRHLRARSTRRPGSCRSRGCTEPGPSS